MDWVGATNMRDAKRIERKVKDDSNKKALNFTIDGLCKDLGKRCIAEAEKFDEEFSKK